MNSKVHIDVNSHYNGVEYPIGTTIAPVNNLKDAIQICVNRGFKVDELLLRKLRKEKLEKLNEQ